MMDSNTVRVVRKVISDIICLLCVGIPLLLLDTIGKPYHRGFFCDDESIRYPYKDSTVPSAMLYVTGLTLPIIVMICTEVYIWYCGGCSAQGSRVAFGRTIPAWVVTVYKSLRAFGFGGLCSQLLTDIGKFSIGRLRPHFMSVCKPAVDCTLDVYKNKYIEDFYCEGENVSMIRQARLSFPSGHSSFSAYSMVYFIIYLQIKWNWKGCHLLKHLVQFACLAMAWGTALSRVSDYKHHWSDVTVGLLLGTIVAIVNATVVSNLFKKKQLTTCNVEVGSKADNTTIDL